MKPPSPYFDSRPWGNELWITNEKPSMVKLLTIHPGEILSLQYHHHRDEFWHVVSGDGSAVVGDKTNQLFPGADCFVARETHHRLIGGTAPLIILELAFGDFDEKDIVRLEDKYGRV